MLDIISSFGQRDDGISTQTTLPVSNKEDSELLDTFEMVEDFAFGGSARKSIDEEQDWQMDFDSTVSREEFLNEIIKSYPAASKFQPQSDFLDNLSPILNLEDRESAQLQYIIQGEEISWLLYDGYDFDPLDQGINIRASYQVEILFQELDIKVRIYPSTSVLTKLFELKVKDLEINDNVNTSHWSKLLTYQLPGPDDPPRVTESSMLSFSWKGVRSNHNEEFVFELGILPLQLYIDQDTFSCLELYFTRDGPAKNDESPQATASNQPSVFFQKIEIEPIVIQIDYKPKRVDIARISQGQLAELVNFLNIDGANVYLKPIKLVGVQASRQYLASPHKKYPNTPNGFRSSGN